MKKARMLSLLLLAGGWGYGQSLSPEVIAAAGDHLSSPQALLSWTIGEPIGETLPGSGASQLNQGFHQASLTVTAIDEPVTGFHFKVYPNPSAGWVYIESFEVSAAFRLELFDASGRALQTEANVPQGAIGRLDLSGYIPGRYVLRLRAESQHIHQTFILVKHNQK